MLRSCLYCHAPFSANDALEHFPVGPRLAFDPARGRLWVVCRLCGRWNLAPIEERWEALEELERLVRDRARLLIQTDNIGLLRAGELELVRVGRAELREEAWWRYGRILARRRVVSWVIGGVQVAAAAASFALTPAFAGSAASIVGSSAQWLRFGSTAWRGEVFCLSCGKPLRRLKFSAASKLVLVPGVDGMPALERECPSCTLRAREGTLRWTGADAQRMLRRILAYQNAAGASPKQIGHATGAVEAMGSPEGLVAHAMARRPKLSEFKERRYRTASLALEIAANDQIERRLLELEAKALELRWQEEESLAAIADGELTPLARLDSLVRRIRQRS